MVEKKRYPARKSCTRCGQSRRRDKFRLLSSGYRQSMCADCERIYERDRWHTRSEESKRFSNGAGARRRAAVGAA